MEATSENRTIFRGRHLMLVFGFRTRWDLLRRICKIKNGTRKMILVDKVR
jgi:hypothetical protein